MRRLAQILVPLMALITLAPAGLAQRAGELRLRDAWTAALPEAPSTPRAVRLLVEHAASRLAAGDTVELAAPVERLSLTASHFYFAQSIGSIPVLNGGVVVSVGGDRMATVHDATGTPHSGLVRVGRPEAIDAALGAGTLLHATEVEGVALVAWIGDDGVARTYQRVILRNGLRRHAVFVDAESGGVAWTEPLFATARGQVFESNPVTNLNDPTLLDGDDSDAAVPQGAYSSSELPELDGSGPLSGPFVSIVDVELPTTARADQSTSLDFTRSRDEFEEVNAYFQIDRAQRYLASLGFVGDRAVLGYPIEVDPHAGGGGDNSSYRFTTPGRGRLFFGDGGVDDAEDADVILHELGHAIQDSIVPTGFTGPSSSESRALGEGFGDYWAFSSSWSSSRATGRDPYCVGDWDARCAPGPSTQCGYDPGSDCLRRVDGTKTMADYIRSGGFGTEHVNGEIWSSALRDFFVKGVTALGDVEGRRTVDRTIIESHFGLPPNPSFRSVALRLIDADRRLNRGLLTAAICTAMSARGIVETSDCDLGLSGDLTLVESLARDVAIPDNDSRGIVATLAVSDTRIAEELLVRVNIAHPRRGDLRLTLIAPDGTSVVLHVEGGDSGPDIKAIYGLDAEPSQSLAALAGKSAAGTWSLRVADVFGVDEGTLLSWGMMFRFAGDTALTTRGAADGSSWVIPVVGNIEGAFGTHFVSDARVANNGTETARATFFFTPSGADGSTSFSAVRSEIPPGATVALDDLVASLFHSGGTGSIEIRSSASLLVTTRIYNDAEAGTYGQLVRVGSSAIDASRPNRSLHILHLANSPSFRSNLGVTEVGGGSGSVNVRLVDAEGTEIATSVFDVLPYSHAQIPLLGGPDGTRSDAFRAEVGVLAGTPRVVAYGSVVDNVSGDAIFVPGWYFEWPVLPSNVPFVVPAVIRAPGANGTYWRSDVRVMNASSTATVRAALTFLPADGSATRTVEIPIAAGDTAILDDVLHERFSIDEGRGALSITALDGADTRSGLVVTSRTWTPGSEGTFGQFIPAGSMLEALGKGASQQSAIHVDSNFDFRCNVGITEIASAPAVVRVRLLDASGVGRFESDVAVPAHGSVQFSLAAVGAPQVSNGRLLFDVVEGEGQVLPWASVIDNATGDPIFVSAW